MATNERIAVLLQWLGQERMVTLPAADAAERLWRARRRSRDALPKLIAATEKANAELRKEAKGLR